ncbi:MAG: hypothetical protein H6737_31005 [Alphaproteobacteria bacterium]|nr:hypothetical protein [Alphaproteobacteria bacterium]
MPGPQVLFAVQVLYPLAMTGSLSEDLVEAVRSAGDWMSPHDKTDWYDGLADALLEQAPHLQFASWEYLDDPEDAMEAYWGWVEGTAEDAEDEAGMPHRDEGHYGFVTVLILAEEGGASAGMLQPLGDIEDEEGVRFDLLEHMLRLLGSLDFGSVTSDVVMVRPGAGGRGVSETRLGDATYHHLGPVL